MDDLLIKCENLSFAYADENDSATQVHPVLFDVTLSVHSGEYVAVLGHNGSGKSTLAKLLNLILIPSSGRLFIEGVDVSSPDLSEDEVFAVREKIGMIFQNPDNQLVATVVEEDVAFGPENLGLPRDEIRKRVDESIDLVGMRDYIKHAPHKLSGGQKQRIAIAGVIAMKPKCIIFDEATAMLDPIGRRDILNIMERLNRDEGITVINITHYMEEAARADRVIVVNDGRLLLDGTPKDVFSNVELLHSIGLEAPQTIELQHALKSYGVDISTDAITVSECVDALLECLEKRC